MKMGEAAEAILAMVREGKPDREIAKALNVSKNTVIGTRTRAGLLANVDSNSAISVAMRGHLAQLLPEPNPKPERPSIVFPDAGCCLFPFGEPRDPDFRFCGAKVERAGASWCEEHHRVVFSTVPAMPLRAPRE